MVKSMFKTDFAEQFYGVSAETLRRWIKSKTQLVEKLEETGYNKHSKMLKPKEILLIREYFG